MAHKPDSKRDLSIKARLLLIAIALVAINLFFYFLFGTSIVSDTDDYNLSIVKNTTSSLENLIIMMHLSLF